EFNEPIDAQSAPPVTGGGVTVLGDYVVSGNTLTFTPAAPLQGGIQYQVYLYNTVLDLAGNYNYIGYRYFTTEATVDATTPTVTTISPTASAVDVNPGAGIRLTFSEPMNPNTVNNNTIALYANGAVIHPSIYRSADGQQVSLTANLPTASIISIVVTDGAQDLSGNPVAPYVSSFTTGLVDTDTSRPSVTQQIPAGGSRDWFGLNEVVLYLNDAMDAASIPDAFHVAQNGVLVDGTLEVLGDNRAIRFTATEAFAEGALIQVYLESLATDDSGNAVYDYDGYFTMGSSDDLVGSRAYPTVYAPYGGQTEVPLNPEIMVRYNEPLDPAALNSARIELQNSSDSQLMPVDVSLDSSGYILQVMPQGLLAANTSYRLTLDDIIDTDGDTNTSRYTSSFTTGATAVEDDRQPIVLAMSPPDGEANVGVNTEYAVRFDERMNPLTFGTDNGQRHNAQFSEDNRVVHYQRLGTLAASTEVTEAVPAMMDIAGNTVIATSSTFTTGAGPDFSAPSVIGSIPSGSANVATNAVIAWVFNEPIDPVSVTTSGVYLRDFQTYSIVATTVNLAADGKRIDIVPTEALLVGRDYRYYAYNLRDLSGNSVSTYRPFTTAFDADVTAPQVLDATVAEEQVDVPTNVRLTVRFDEPLSELTASEVSLVDAGGTSIAHSATLNSDRTMLTVVPTQLLIANADYTFSVDGVEDLSGHLLAAPLVVNFTTGDTVDLLTGAITAWSIPSNSTENVPLNALLEVTLSERVDPTSINSSSFYLYDGTEGRKVAGNWALSSGDRVLTFTPDALLEPDHRYDLNVGYHPYLKDLAGNYITQNTQRYFYTGGSVDEAA
ncbi:MAG: Ig-like domain-containing protein, partial [Aestuariibacter sp.]|nr:Ig-like domain-containing protein [Aestuariibacter sp.]